MAAEYSIGTQDRVRVEIYEYPNISGEYVVRQDGTLNLPVIGKVEAAGHSETELGQMVSDALAKKGTETNVPSVTVQVTQYRPFFILGDVQQPGSFAYQPQLTVLQALSLAGGLYRLRDQNTIQITRDDLQSRGEFEKLKVRSIQLLYQKARLTAEIQNQDQITFPDNPIVRQYADFAETARGHEQTIFDTRRSTFRLQSDTLQKLKSFYEDEIASLQKEIELRSGQLELEKQQLQVVDNMVSKGIATTSRSLEQRRATADIESRQQELLTQILHAKQGEAETDQSLQNLSGDRSQAITVSLRETDQQISETDENLRTNANLIRQAQLVAPQSYSDMGSGRSQISYEIVRANRHIPAAESDPVLPGDVIEVRQQPASDQRSALTQTARPEPNPQIQ